jgi:phospholipid/cholesterol/gamma-HCH transport system substrate-binding protein
LFRQQRLDNGRGNVFVKWQRLVREASSMSRSLTRLQAVLLGVVFLCGLGLAGTGLYAVGNRQWLWADTFHVRAGFPQIHGVEIGTRVRVQGIEAGEVEAIEPPAAPGGNVIVRMRLDGSLRSLLRSDALVQIASEGMIGGKVLEINPGTASATPVAENALLASKPSAELTDILGQVNSALAEIRDGQGTVGKMLKDPQAYRQLVAALEQSRETLESFKQDADAIKRLPVVRGYVEDPEALLVRPNCERNRQWFAESDLFEPGRAVLTTGGRRRLDDLAPWLAGLKHKGSEIVVVTFADPQAANANVARTLTRQQSDAVCAYLKEQHAVQKMGWFSSRKVAALGLGISPPPVPEKENLPPARVEVLVFVPQG